MVAQRQNNHTEMQNGHEKMQKFPKTDAKRLKKQMKDEMQKDLSDQIQMLNGPKP